AYFGKSIPDQPEIARERMLALMAEIEQQDDVWTAILYMPFTEDRKSKIELAFYSELIPDLYMSGLVPQLYLSAAQSTLHCLQGGMDESVIYSFSIMGLNLGEQGKFEQAFLYEDLAHDLCAKYPNTFGATRGMNGIVWCNMHSRNHPAEIVDYCHKAIQSGKNCGDLYNAGLSYGPLMWILQVQGKDLRQVDEAAEECLHFSRKNQLSFSVGLAEAVLAGWVAPMRPDYQPVDMAETLARWEAENYVAASGSYFALLGFAQHYMGDYAEATVSLQAVERYMHGLTDNVLKRLWYVFRIVNRLRWPEGADWPTLEAEITPLLAELETWARLGPLLKPYLAFIHAEIARARNQMREARNLYLDAIAIAQAQNYGLLTGHLYESLAEVLTAGNLGDAQLYYSEARRMYRVCRADRKSALLQQRHPYTAPDNAVRAEKTIALDTSATLPNLDFNYLIKSALALSAEVDLNQLMQKIMTVVLESSGAQHGYLLIKDADDLLVAAESHVGKKHIVKRRRISLNQSRSTAISRSIVNYVLRTRKKVLLHDAMAEGKFQDTPEVQALKLRSVLCLPVIKQNELIGLLYLENRLSPGVFTAERTDMTELLTAQVAISLENARLLEQTRLAYTQLQENQEHMLQMEKLSALGTLVGGVAHEINNPLMGVMNFVEFAADRSTDERSKEILDQALQQIHRIKKIVSNMLLFVHTRSAPTGTCKIPEVIRQSLLLLEGELSKGDIDVDVDVADDLPAIRCSADSLQQILVNLIINSRDALADSPQAQPKIKIMVRPIEEMLELNITDNGPGIPQDIQSKIFDPFFTTKPPGKGTGLGLSVIRRLVQDVGGTIHLESSPGHGCSMRLRFPRV
ncbi:MAG: GAF domain-containing sensor histidine kinase, partial [Methylobacter sp.]